MRKKHPKEGTGGDTIHKMDIKAEEILILVFQFMTPQNVCGGLADFRTIGNSATGSIFSTLLSLGSKH